jgi:hypothetical protein
MGLQASGALTPSGGGGQQTQDMQKMLAQQQQQTASQEQQAMRAAALNQQGSQGQFLSNPAFQAQVADLIGQPGDLGLAAMALGSQPGTVFSTEPGQQNPFQTSTGLTSSPVGGG